MISLQKILLFPPKFGNIVCKLTIFTGLDFIQNSSNEICWTKFQELHVCFVQFILETYRGKERLSNPSNDIIIVYTIPFSNCKYFFISHYQHWMFSNQYFFSGLRVSLNSWDMFTCPRLATPLLYKNFISGAKYGLLPKYSIIKVVAPFPFLDQFHPLNNIQLCLTNPHASKLIVIDMFNININTIVSECFCKRYVCCAHKDDY